MLKHEDCPGLAKLSAIRAASARGDVPRVSILCGNGGGLFLPEELTRGADGAMTGFAYPEMMVDVCQAHASGDIERAHDLFDAYLPLARYEQQAGIGLAVRKHLMVQRGAMASAKVRKPGPAVVGCRPGRHRAPGAAAGTPAGRTRSALTPVAPASPGTTVNAQAENRCGRAAGRRNSCCGRRTPGRRAARCGRSPHATPWARWHPAHGGHRPRRTDKRRIGDSDHSQTLPRQVQMTEGAGTTTPPANGSGTNVSSMVRG
jgi:hypothetical protein